MLLLDRFRLEVSVTVHLIQHADHVLDRRLDPTSKNVLIGRSPNEQRGFRRVRGLPERYDCS